MNVRRPAATQTIRFRLTIIYSTVLFAIAAAGLGVTYLAVERTTDPKPITQSYEADLIKRKADGRPVRVGTIEVAAVAAVESEVNLRTLEAMRNYSIVALGGLFLLSLGTGWILSGRVLRPVRSIVVAAQEIQATDLSRRINLAGPQDELRNLADTVDLMLGRLEHAFGAQRQLIDDASHELRSPLAIIRAHLEASLTPDDVDDQERRRAVVVIERATSRMSRLVEDLLATARRDSPASTDTRIRLDLLLAETAEDFAVLTAGSRLRVERPAERSINSPTVVGDHDALRRAVSNLLSNAVRVAPAGTAIQLETGQLGSWAWIAVTDHGPGIADEDRARVFDRFWRGPEREPEPAPGTTRERRAGLGLAIVRQIVESHRGRMAVHSEVGVGSTFVLWLPLPGRSDDAPPPQAVPGSARGAR